MLAISTSNMVASAGVPLASSANIIQVSGTMISAPKAEASIVSLLITVKSSSTKRLSLLTA